MRLKEKLWCVGMIAVLAGCSSLNPFASKAAPRNPPAPLQEIKPALGVRTVWSATVGNSGNYQFAPALAGDSVYAAAADGTLTRIDAASGRSIWRISAGAPLTAGVGSDGTTVAVVADKGVLMAFDADGKLRWKVQASSEVLSAPAVGQGLVIVRSADNRVSAYDVSSGTRRWVAQRPTPPLTLRSAPGLVISGNNVYVGLPGGRLLALALTNGGARWEVAVGDPRGTTELERIADMSGTPVVQGGEVCAVAYQGRLACFDAASGAARWGKELSSEVGVGVDERHVYAADAAGNVTAFVRGTGSGAWRNNKLSYRRLSAPVPVGKAVAVGDFEGHVHFLSREDGALLARVPTDGSQINAGLAAGNGVMIVQTRAGTVTALKAE
ncbi:outer membrane protein assembly factor BamB [Noviherbaspirillum aridicola]|uniref:Outer membrane protein assembly factor BamB n=1 Tax=Noviherbaspirillum aridicola TaxID=2849687 RepID=A0ABQ4Q723_9BURK|nr:outer membrane protein assembly factor BamB [Noviherbaspirillum aridicola]GIZ52610.1 outer membrane protein assembly factor BamB [Noviherbaspirillum aridicola]